MEKGRSNVEFVSWVQSSKYFPTYGLGIFCKKWDQKHFLYNISNFEQNLYLYFQQFKKPLQLHTSKENRERWPMDFLWVKAMFEFNGLNFGIRLIMGLEVS